MATEPAGDPTLPRWLGSTIVAFGATVGHAFTDYHMGLFGAQSPSMSAGQGGVALALAAMYAFWAAAIAAAAAGDAFALRAVFWLTVLEAVLLNGAIAVAAAPPPSDAFPFQDLFHLLALGAGLTAAHRLWTAQRAGGEPRGSLTWLFTVGLVILVATGARTALQIAA